MDQNLLILQLIMLQIHPDSSLESISKLNPKLHSLNFSSVLKINQKMQDGPLQPKILNQNTDNSVKIPN